MMKFYDADVLLIGLGAGGAVAARSLVEGGCSVIALEMGGPPLPISPDELISSGPEKHFLHGVANEGESYFAGLNEADPNDAPHVYRTANGRLCVTKEGWTASGCGGGTTLYGGVSIRFHPRDFSLRENLSGRTLTGSGDEIKQLRKDVSDWPVTAAEMEPYYIRVEDSVGISGTVDGQEKHPYQVYSYQSPLPASAISKISFDGLQSLGMKCYRTPQAYITSNHRPSSRTAPNGRPQSRQGLLNGYHDPSGGKSSAFVTHVKPLLSNPSFDLRCFCTAYELRLSRNQISEVLYFDAMGEACMVTARVVVLSAGAVESIRLTLLSAESSKRFRRHVNRSGLVGRHFMSHVFGGADLVVESGRYDKTEGLESDWATDHCQQAEFLRENGLWAGGVLYNLTNNCSLPISFVRSYRDQGIDRPWRSFLSQPRLYGQNLVDFINAEYGRLVTMMVMGNQVPNWSNRIGLEPTILDRWGLPAARIEMAWHPQDFEVTRILAGKCRDILEAGSGQPVRSFGGVCQSDNSGCRINNHLLGGLRFGDSADTSVLDRDCRFWRLDNLYVVDGSFMPTGGGANPTLSIQANALRVAEKIAERI